MVRAGDRERKTETDRARARLACARHLKDLRLAHAQPPPDVAVRASRLPARLAPEPISSHCTSPGFLCAELMS
jgi:hypothetical protein